MIADFTLSIRFPVEVASLNGDDQQTSWREAIVAAEHLRELIHDWDGNGASRPEEENIAAAINWLKHMPQLDRRAIPPTHVTAGSLGEVVFIWQSASQFIEAEIERPDAVEWMVRVGDADPEFCSTPMSRAVVLALEELTVVRC